MLEPEDINTEAKFQQTIITICRKNLEAAGVRYLLIERFGLDIAIWIATEELPLKSQVKMFEIKAFTGARQGGVGFGNNQGKGPQVDLLINDFEKLGLLSQTIRWLFVDTTMPIGTARYAIVTSEVAKAAAMGGVQRGKQNNFRVTELRKHAVKFSVFCERLIDFLLVR